MAPLPLVYLAGSERNDLLESKGYQVIVRGKFLAIITPSEGNTQKSEYAESHVAVSASDFFFGRKTSCILN